MRLEIFVVGGNLNVPGVVVAPYSTIVYMEHEDKKILVDPGSFVTHQALEKKLMEKGLTRLDITDVLLTHFHLDHAYSTRYFENATIYVHENYEKKDYEKFGDIVGKEYMDTLKSWKSVKKLRGGEKLFEKIEVLHTPWHAREHVSFIVETENLGKVFLPGDICFTKLDYYEMVKGYREGASSEFCVDKAQEVDLIVFTHDEPLVVKR